jgi:K(+)-stimulated pyrophosphate-energized sodium pump
VSDQTETTQPSEGLVSYINQGLTQIARAYFKSALQFLGLTSIGIIGLKILMGERPSIGIPIMIVAGVGIAAGLIYCINRLSTNGLLHSYSTLSDPQKNQKTLTQISLKIGGLSLGVILTVSLVLIAGIAIIFKTHGGTIQHQLETSIITTTLAITLGTTLIVAFIRIATSIYAKITDLTTDTVGRTEYDLLEDDLRNPGSIPDMVGDMLNKSIGMGSLIYECTLFCIVSSMVMSLISLEQLHNVPLLKILHLIGQPFLIVALGGLVSCGMMLLQLKRDVTISVTHMILATYASLCGAVIVLEMSGLMGKQTSLLVATGCAVGLALTFNNRWAMTSQSQWVAHIIKAFDTGAVSGFLRGILYAILSSIIPVIAMATLIFITFTVSGGFQNLLQGFHSLGIALLALLSPVPLLMSLGVIGAIADNSHGISQMLMDEDSTKHAKKLDLEGTENSALIKVFIIVAGMSSCLILMLLFVRRMMNIVMDPTLTIQQFIHILDLSILHPDIILGVFMGSMVIIAVSGVLIFAVQSGTEEITTDIRRQMSDKPGIWTGESLPDYHLIIDSVNQRTIKWVNYILAGILIIPIVSLLTIEFDGSLGVMLGMITTGTIVSLVASYAGALWQMAKKTIEMEDPNYMTSSRHLSSVFVDGIGDVLKDTVAPSLYMIVKLISVIAIIAGGLAL